MSISETETAHADTNWSTFFEQFDSFDQRRKKQKQSGMNDYSLLGAVLRISDEVRLHSRFLFSMLNPDGAHFQHSAFCEKFMLALGYPDWLDWSELRVFREHNNIDLYLTDGERHVLIENKLNANDQHRQVSRYIDWVGTECNAREMPASPGDILFVYLSNGRQAPTPRSLQPYQLCTSIDGSFVVDERQRKVARYVNAHYRNHILSWISSCLDLVGDVGNLLNVRNAFLEYRLVVERVTRTYQSPVMNLEAFLLQTSPEFDSRSRIRHAFEIAREMSSIKAKWLATFFEAGLSELFNEHVGSGRLIPITAEDSRGLKSFQFARDHARRFFAENGSKDARNKGRFWRVWTGSSSRPVALAVLFGAKNLHIGVLPIQVGDSGIVEVDERLVGEFKLVVATELLEFKGHPGINGVLPGLVSWTVPPDKEIEDLSNLQGSRAKLIINALVEHVLHDRVVSFQH